MAKVTPRDVTPVLKLLREVCLGRKHNPVSEGSLRFQGHNIVPRTQPAPNLPEGPHHVLSANYYCNRDASHEVKHPAPLYLAQSAQKQIGESRHSSSASNKLRTPGVFYDWDSH